MAVAMSTLFDLRLHASWEPSRLLAGAFEWPIQAPTVALRELVSLVAPASFVDAGTPVITPAGVDSIRGGVRRRSRKYQGAVYQVGAELRPGDLLVPRSPSGPVLLVSDTIAGALVSSTYYALRPRQEVSALWLWGLLNSRSGFGLRKSLAASSTALLLSSADLLDIAVPLPTPGKQHELLETLQSEAATTHIEEEEAPETWWRTADLRGSEWRFMLASPRPELLHEGTPLKNYCGAIVKGRPARDIAVEAYEVGFLPVVDIRMLSGNPPRRWVPVTAERVTAVHPGDLCVAAPGERSHATVVQTESVADLSVYVLRLREPRQGPALAQYLNGQEGFALRRMLISGAVIPSLRLEDLKSFPVRPSVLEHPVQDPRVISLADRLERLLWQS